MRTSGKGSGGGYGSKQHVETKVRTGTGSHGTRPAGVNMLGAMQGNKVTSQRGTTSYTGEPLHGGRSFNPVPFGNSVALNVGEGGPGKGRTLHGQSGSQGCHGSPASGNPPPNAQRHALNND
jgi:hypothetical protein